MIAAYRTLRAALRNVDEIENIKAVIVGLFLMVLIVTLLALMLLLCPALLLPLLWRQRFDWVKLAYRWTLAAIRKAIKPLLLWINACRYQESEHEVSRLDFAREDAVRMMRRQRERQVRLQERRSQIARW